MRDQNDRALVIVDRLDQRGAAVDVEMVRRLVEDQKMRPVEGRDAEQQPRLFAAREIGDFGVGLDAGKADLRRAAANARLGASRHQPRDAPHRACRFSSRSST